ncbi:MAG: AbrB/MazE/SpoVT family DNA-binding domain-containing protein [Nitrospinae bacterium]|nr:AbrB/MazE/SpoVT family DNA-binding domain-containing protein [Nitrospinota bacterium]
MTTKTTKIRKMGGSSGIVLPKDILAHIGAREGDDIFIIKGKDSIEITAYDPAFADSVKRARHFRSRYKNAMRELSK